MKKKITFEEGMQELEALVHGLEAGELSLEDSFQAYEKAVALKNSLSALLDAFDEAGWDWQSFFKQQILPRYPGGPGAET